MEKKAFEEILENVPCSFKSKIDRIRRYLQLGKASVMVGAGFSCNADVPSYIMVKQWNDVGKDIYCRLKNVEKPVLSDLVFKTPMRLASQFTASFGRNELDNLIRDAIPDDRMNPGELHKALLNLPWRDVFTTNYDTLLERAREGLVRTYSVVTSKEMLLYKKSPRIIKLHGSFPDKTPFLMTEEDYKNYPVDHPEFVNTVRQALVESVFCLVGFSGDDPNFISWQGWLRDVMGDYAGPSYLITCDRGYDDSFKTLMEHRGIEVLNFSMVKDLDDYKTALDFFFTYLSVRESEWTGYVKYDEKNIDAEQLIEQMKSVRLSYPGWFILPKKYYDNLKDTVYQFPYLEPVFKNIDKQYREPLLFELDWRADISLSFKDFDWYRENLETIIHSYGDAPLSNEAITLALSLLRLYRHHPDKNDKAKVLYEQLKNEKSRMTSYQTSRFYYIAACNALSILDYDTVTEILAEWQPTPSCYEGIIYKALVLAESRELSCATELLSEALERITQSLTQTTTSEELSLRSVMEELLDLYNKKSMGRGGSASSFIEIRDSILRNISMSVHDSFEVKHGFGVDAESRYWHLDSGTNTRILYPYRYLLLCEAYGVPYSIEGDVVNEKILTQLLPQMTSFGIPYSLGVVLRSSSRKVTISYANRSTLNTLTRECADKLATQLLKTTTQTVCEKVRKQKETRVLLPFLSRLSSLCSEEIVSNIYKFCLQAYRKARFCDQEDLNIIYSNVLPACVQEVFTEAFSSALFEDIRRRDIPLPDDGYKYYKPGKVEIAIVREGLSSSRKNIRDSAYCRAMYLLQAQIDENKEELVSAIRAWRVKEASSIFTRHSYTLVSPSNKEWPMLKKRVEEDLSLFFNGDYKYAGSSSPISSLKEALHHLVLLVSFLEEEQISAILEKLADILDNNYAQSSIDDSNELLGGLRHFIVPVYKKMEEFVCIIIRKGYSNKKPCQKLFAVLEKDLSSHLPVRTTLERLNNVLRKLSLNKMREIVTAQLFSENEADIIDSCEALIAHADSGGSIQKVLQNLIFYCNYAVTDKMRLYLQTLILIPYEKMSKATREQLANMMLNVLERIPKQSIREEQKVDIMHAGVRLAVSLKRVATDAAIVDAVKAWADYANSETVYNDIRRPWFIN